MSPVRTAPAELTAKDGVLFDQAVVDESMAFRDIG